MLGILLSSSSGCVYGLLYTSIDEPLVTNMNSTPRGVQAVNGDTHMVSIPLTVPGLSAEWDSRAIGDAAKNAGLSEVYYADLHTFSVLGGVWQEQTVQVYGK